MLARAGAQQPVQLGALGQGRHHRRLVDQQQARLAHERPGEHRAHALAHRERGGEVVGVVGHARPVQLAPCPALGLVQGGPVGEQRQSHEVDDPLAPRGTPVVGGQQADVVAQQPLALQRRQLRQVAPFEVDAPPVGRLEARGQAQQRGLARPPLAEDADVLAAVDLEGGLLEHHGLAASVGVGLA